MRKLLFLFVVFLVSCSQDAGQLNGTWQTSMFGVPIVTVTFTDDYMESMGVVEKVTYKHDGDSVYVTSEDGTTLHYLFVDFLI